MKVSDRETELFLYWKIVHEIRTARRLTPDIDVTGHLDELDDIAFNTEWPRMRDMVALAAQDIAGPLEIDLAAFEITPPSPAGAAG